MSAADKTTVAEILCEFTEVRVHLGEFSHKKSLTLQLHNIDWLIEENMQWLYLRPGVHNFYGKLLFMEINILELLPCKNLIENTIND